MSENLILDALGRERKRIEGLLTKVAELEQENRDCDECSGLAQKDVDELVAVCLTRKERNAELETREQLWRDYIAFLKVANQGPATMAHVHGWRCPDEDVKRGEQFRKDLGIAESEVN